MDKILCSFDLITCIQLLTYLHRVSTFLWSFTLQKTPKIVSAELATVLRFSRFSKHLDFQPLEPGTTAPTDDVYSNADPFAYCAANSVAKTSGSCCAKPAQQEKTGGCSKPAEEKNGCGLKCCWRFLFVISSHVLSMAVRPRKTQNVDLIP